jgi:negative regulator of sigma E activity
MKGRRREGDDAMKSEIPDERLSAYLDGELRAEERAAVDAELAAHSEVRQALDELRSIGSQLRELPRHSAGPEFADRVVAVALAARARSNGAVELASKADLAPSPVHRRRAIVPAALAGLAGVAAAVALAVWIAGGGNSQAPNQPLAQGNSVPASAVSEAAQQALASLRQAFPQEGEAVVVRLRFGATRQELDAALAAAGIVARVESDGSTGAMGYGKAYHDKLLEKFGGQLAEGTITPADAMFVEAPLEAIEKAIASLASTPEAVLEMSPLMKVAAAKIAGEPDEIGHGEAAAQSPGAAPKFYAQRLNPGMFRLEKAGKPTKADGQTPAAAIDATRPIRLLILIDPAE